MILTPYNYPQFYQDLHSAKPPNWQQNHTEDDQVIFTSDPESGLLIACRSLNEALEISEEAKYNGLDFDEENHFDPLSNFLPGI